jgi:hypothetical protein
MSYNNYGNVSPRRFTPRLPPIDDPKIHYIEERLKNQENTTQALLGIIFNQFSRLIVFNFVVVVVDRTCVKD